MTNTMTPESMTRPHLNVEQINNHCRALLKELPLKSVGSLKVLENQAKRGALFDKLYALIERVDEVDFMKADYPSDLWKAIKSEAAKIKKEAEGG